MLYFPSSVPNSPSRSGPLSGPGSPCLCWFMRFFCKICDCIHRVSGHIYQNSFSLYQLLSHEHEGKRQTKANDEVLHDRLWSQTEVLPYHRLCVPWLRCREMMAGNDFEADRSRESDLRNARGRKGRAANRWNESNKLARGCWICSVCIGAWLAETTRGRRGASTQAMQKLLLILVLYVRFVSQTLGPHSIQKALDAASLHTAPLRGIAGRWHGVV